MHRLTQIAFGVLAAVILFALSSRYLHLQTWVSAVLAGLTIAVTLIGQVLDFAKKPLELAKLALETAKLRRDATKEKENERLVKPATLEEVKEYGISYTERKLKALYQ